MLEPMLSAAAPERGPRKLLGLLRPASNRERSPHGALGPDEARRFRDSVLPHLDEALAFARFLCRDPNAAEDLVQDSYLSAYRAFAGFRGGSAKAWLFAIVRNRFLDSTRSRRGGRELSLADAGDPDPPDPDTPETLLLRTIDDQALRAAIEGLPEPFREAVVLRDLQEFNYRQIADITGAAMGTVMSRLARGRRLLAAALAAEDRA